MILKYSIYMFRWSKLIFHSHALYTLYYFQITGYQKRACPELAKAYLGGPCLNSRITQTYEINNNC